MEEIKVTQMVAGETYLRGDEKTFKVYARYYNDRDGRWEVLGLLSLKSGEQAIDRSWDCTWLKFYKKPKTLAEKFQIFGSSYSSGTGKQYWEGLENIALEHFTGLVKGVTK